jgi:ribonuclease HI
MMLRLTLLFYQIVVSTAIVVALQFDGSFRPPKDPGYLTLESKMASCAACLFLEEEENSTSVIHSPIGVAGRFLPIPVDMTSAHAEYEGLLLGLESLLSTTHLVSRPTRLRIQGDCKTVLDQLSGKSTSRKLQHLHTKSQSLLQQLALFEEVEYQHIPRTANVLSDNLCGNLMTVASNTIIQQCLWDIERKEVPLLETLRKHIGSIKYSIRPLLYEHFWNEALNRKEYFTMVEIGKLLVIESSRTKGEKYILKGVVYQLQGLRGMGHEHEAAALERKHRVLLSRAKAEDFNDIKRQDIPELFLLSNTEPSWDMTSISQEWTPLLNQWWNETTQSSSWEEGSTIRCISESRI